MARKRSTTIYGLLASAWIAAVAWQVVEHNNIEKSARAALLNRARDISNSVSVVIRSLGRFGFVSQKRIEAALNELTDSQELLGVALLNASYEVAAAAGEPIDLDPNDFTETNERWTDKTVTVVNLVDLGPESRQGDLRPTTIVMPSPDEKNNSSTGDDKRSSISFPKPIDEGHMDTIRSIKSTEPLNQKQVDAIRFVLDKRPIDKEIADTFRSLDVGDTATEEQLRTLRAFARGFRPGEGRGSGRGDGRSRNRGSRQFFKRPPWMTEERYQALVEQQGVHAFVLAMSTAALRAEEARDLWLRAGVAAIALVAVFGVGLAWRGLERSADLQMRLMRASEMNAHLQEMNVAAAGLAHETRNPLNIIRGLAQMISQQEHADEQIRERAHAITCEVDRVTGRLNQFMDYSKPLDARPAPVSLNAVVGDVASALESDLEDKNVQINITGPGLTVEADESLLRQVLFNLLLNAIQSVDEGGSIEITFEKTGANEAAIIVADNGPGVAPENRDEVFRPYYTTSENGTGLGLAVVRQIVLAHQWDISCGESEMGGASFRITGIRTG